MVECEEIVLQTAEVRVRVMVLAAGASTAWHRHSQVSDQMVCLEGRIRVELQGPEVELLPLQPGERCLVPVGRVHRVVNAGAEAARYLLVQGVGAYDFIEVGAADAVPD